MHTTKFLICADLETREYLWNLFLKYSLFVNQLIREVIDDQDFETWRSKGVVSRENLKKLCDNIREKDKSFAELPARIYTSAISTVLYTFNSWFEVQKSLGMAIEGKQNWLQLVETDIALSENTDFSDTKIRARAAKVLTQVENELKKERKKLASKKALASKMSLLFKKWKTTKLPLTRRAIAHLLKNSCQVNLEEEDPDQLALRLERKRVEIERLQKQLESRLPKGRDLLGQHYEEALEKAIALPDVSEDFETWEQDEPNRMAEMSRLPKTLPYPILFGSNDDVYWSKVSNSSSNQSTEKTTRTKPKRCRTRKRQRKSKERIHVCFRGVGLSDLRLAVYCDRRQQPILKQFFTDYSSFHELEEEKKFSMSLFALRSASLLWREDHQELHKTNHWKLQNLWLKWFSGMQVPEQSSCSSHELELFNQRFESWFKGLLYLTLSKRLPWKTHRLYLHCTYDPRLLTAEGTEQIRQEKLAQKRAELERAEAELEKMGVSGEFSEPSEEDDSEEEEELLSSSEESKKKQARIKHLKTSLKRLENNLPPPRPSKAAYQGESQIAVGVCFTLNKLVGAAVVDQRVPCLAQSKLPEPLKYLDLRGLLTKQDSEVLKKRSQKIREKFIKSQVGRNLEQELDFKVEPERKGKGKHRRKRRRIPQGTRSLLQLKLEDYRLVGRWSRLKKKNQFLRSKEQQQGFYARSEEESNLMQHINHLIANRIVELCQKWRASCIIIPDFQSLRESVECEIQAKARRLFPDDNVNLQKAYQKKVRMSMHRWSHKQLAQSIRSCAAKHGIRVVTGYQTREGTMKEKAVAICTATNDSALNSTVA
ncbi:hypothetical protein H6G89_32585 [Oscillatoria sp. FACHB-1407]|uniref:type V CRISPR-associated protein Cas12k n=1 Tax=Oscillatoria sp. FACHB-1407 TaxID=2692847 RepID=UPI001683D722|nr:type V CRISPR-associated protein Cas12k [Oscillatoria sp. FACHB-1407]MBD2465727.1 hypothetical protein [Oscillatoria sp. FACHB-1407]